MCTTASALPVTVPASMTSGTLSSSDRSSSGETVPRHHITRVTYTLNDRPVMVAHCSTAVAKNPWLTFAFGGARPGDRLAVAWVDNLGNTDSLEMILD